MDDNYITIIDEFHRNTLDCVNELLRHHEELNTETAMKKLHTMKGSSVNVGAARLAVCFQLMEGTIRNHQAAEFKSQLETARLLPGNL